MQRLSVLKAYHAWYWDYATREEVRKRIFFTTITKIKQKVFCTQLGYDRYINGGNPIMVTLFWFVSFPNQSVHIQNPWDTGWHDNDKRRPFAYYLLGWRYYFCSNIIYKSPHRWTEYSLILLPSTLWGTLQVWLTRVNGYFFSVVIDKLCLHRYSNASATVPPEQPWHKSTQSNNS